MTKLTKDWVKKAEADLSTAALLQSQGGLHDNVCFHCQQCGEKYLKAILNEVGAPVPRIHDLTSLRDLLERAGVKVRGLTRGLNLLTSFAVGPRYPEYMATKRQAAAALRWAGKVRDACRDVLGVKAPRRRKS